MKKTLLLIIQYIAFFFTHIGDSPASRRLDWENRDCPNNYAKRKRKARDLTHIANEKYLKATGRI